MRRAPWAVVLCGNAFTPVTDEPDGATVRDLVLSAPALDRLVSLVLVRPDDLGLALRRRTPVGVRWTDDALPPGCGDPTAHLCASLAASAALGARASSWELDLGGEHDAVRRADRIRRAVAWAVACRVTGLLGVLLCTAGTPPRATLDQAEAVQRLLLADLAHALGGWDGIRPAVDLVRPGRRSSQVATAEDSARATVRSLHAAALPDGAALAVRAPALPGDLAAGLAALACCGREWRWGFVVDNGFLSALVMRPDRAADAIGELRARLAAPVAVLRAAVQERGAFPTR